MNLLRRTTPGLLTALLLVSVFTAAATPLLVHSTAHANAPYNASDVIGHVDQNGGPVFDTSKWTNGPSASGLSSPDSMTLDAVSHRLYARDCTNYRILVFNLDTSNNLLDHTADYVLGQPNFTTNTPHNSNTATARDFSFDCGNNTDNIVFDPGSGYLYVAAGAYRVLVFDTSVLTNYMDATYVLGQSDLTSNDNNVPTDAKGFSGINTIAIDSAGHRLFVTDGVRNRVLVFDTTTITNNEDAVNVLGQSNFTNSGQDTNAKGFNNAAGIAFDPSNNLLFVADRFNNRILVFDTTTITNNEDAVNVLGQADFTSNGSDTNAKGFFIPGGLLFDSANNRLYASDLVNNRILIFNTTTITNNMDAIDVIGQTDTNGTPRFTSGYTNNVAFPNNKDIGPEGVDVDPVNHRLYVSDTNDSRIFYYELDSSNNLVDRLPDYVIGVPDYNSYGCQSLSADTLCSPTSIKLDILTHHLYVADGNYSRIMIYNLSNTNVPIDGTADYVLGQPDFTTANCNTSPTSAEDLCFPTSMDIDTQNHRLFVTDYGGSRVLIYDLDSNNVPLDKTADYVLGQPDFTSSGCSTSANNLCGPHDVFLDTVNHHLFVADTDNNRVLVYNLDSSNIPLDKTADYVLGQVDFNTQNYAECYPDPTSASGLCIPRGITADLNSHQLFIADTYNNRVLIYNLDSTNFPLDNAADGVLGQADYVSNAPTTSQIGLNAPTRLGYDAMDKHLFVSDNDGLNGFGNNRILIFNFANINLGSGDPNTKVTIPDAKFGVPYDYAIPITGTQGYVTCTLESGTLPLNVVITTDCHVKGTPGSNTPYTFTVKVTDANGNAGTYSDSQVLGLTVEHPDSTSSTGSLADTGDNPRTLQYIAVILVVLSGSVLGKSVVSRRNRRAAWSGRSK
ncbi:MAG TPA: NHL repeat-containing protein [Candidatus Saccharimonadales bacterium]|nr:NHL repeat-containing protein [Candidatus Saccharimonadales bacterium]